MDDDQKRFEKFINFLCEIHDQMIEYDLQLNISKYYLTLVSQKEKYFQKELYKYEKKIKKLDEDLRILTNEYLKGISSVYFTRRQKNITDESLKRIIEMHESSSYQFIRNAAMDICDEDGENPYFEIYYDWEFEDVLEFEINKDTPLLLKETFDLPKLDQIMLGAFYISSISTIFEIIEDPEIINKKLQNKPKRTAFKWIKNDRSKLISIYDKMKGFLIDENVSIEEFIFIFSGKTIPIMNKKINWLDQKVLLPYFIESLSSRGFIEDKKHMFAKLESLFSDINRRTLNKTFNDSYKPDEDILPLGHKKIDSLFY